MKQINRNTRFTPHWPTLIGVALLLASYHVLTQVVWPVWAAPSAQVNLPTVIPYQGMLTDSTGQPVDGTVNLTFRLYSSPSGGTALWMESHNSVPIQKGLFKVSLGSQTAIADSVWQISPLYVGITVNGDGEMTPREQLGNVPYAHIAQTALTVPDGVITSDKMAPTFLEKVLKSEIQITTPLANYQTVLEMDVKPTQATTYLIFARMNTKRAAAGGRMNCAIRTETDTHIFGMESSHGVAGTPGAQTTSGFSVHTFDPGSHKLLLRCTRLDSSSNNGYVRSGSHLMAIPFSPSR